MPLKVLGVWPPSLGWAHPLSQRRPARPPMALTRATAEPLTPIRLSWPQHSVPGTLLGPVLHLLLCLLESAPRLLLTVPLPPSTVVKLPSLWSVPDRSAGTHTTAQLLISQVASPQHSRAELFIPSTSHFSVSFQVPQGHCHCSAHQHGPAQGLASTLPGLVAVGTGSADSTQVWPGTYLRGWASPGRWHEVCYPVAGHTGPRSLGRGRGAGCSAQQLSGDAEGACGWNHVPGEFVTKLLTCIEAGVQGSAREGPEPGYNAT